MRPEPRVAMWTSWETRCGIASYSAALVQALRDLGLPVEIVTVPYTDRNPAQAAARLERLNAVDMVHLQHEYTFFGGIAPGSSSLPGYLRQLRRPHLITAHTVFSAGQLLRVETETRPRQRLAKRLLAALPSYRRTVEVDPFRKAQRVIVHTLQARQDLQRRGIPDERLAVIPAGMPTPHHPPSAEEVGEFRRKHQLPERHVLGIFGYVTQDKGYETALEALRLGHPALHLLIAGGTRAEHEAGYMQQLRAEIQARGLERRVSITGYLEEADLPAAMAACDLVLAPHLAANGSYSVRVALAHGRAVLASNLPCFNELREENAGVETFELGDETSLAERIGFLMASGWRRRLEEDAARYAAVHSWQTVANRTAELYRQVMAENRS